MGRFLTIDLISAIARGRGAAGLMLIITTRPLDMVVPEHPLHTLKRDLLVHRLCQEPRQSARVTHLYSVKVTHTKNTIWNGIRCGTDYGPALSSTP